MDVELITEEDEDYAISENNAEYIDFAGVRCGICMDVVIDRGVLDCCQHWFCFTCIDNWASITNLCPLCQIEFQMITCVPVFDTIGSNETDEDLDSRDDDWRIEGQNNTASFPSYYIDENAVVCLEGDSCKIRSRSATFEADSVLDTSIACDACDVWYHAICVGFDPEGTCENSWHCPRCLTGQKPENKEDDAPLSVDNMTPDQNVDIAVITGSKRKYEDTRIPDTGVIEAELGGEASPKRVKVEALEENNQLVSLIDSSSVSDDKFLTITENAEPTCESEQNDISYESSGIRNIVMNGVSSESSDHINIVKSGVSSESYDITNIVKNGISSKSSGIRNGVGSESSDHMNIVKNGICSESSGIRDIVMNVVSSESSDHMNIVENGICSESSGIKNRVMNGVNSESSDHMNIVKNDVSSESSDHMNIVKNGVYSESSDIMNIVQDTTSRCGRLAARANATNASSEGGENVARLRVKKIMRRTGDDADSSLLVQKLRNEIREAVRNKSTEEIGESMFDPKLLAAFRAAIAGEETEFKKPPLDLKAKKALLQKGKVRENLTKKIYGVGGKRKRAWTRDCEVEFWKHRCSKFSRPEKLQTLNSVLKLLRNDTSSKELRRDNDGEILSRLYLADTSIFPRKDDIKPVAAQKDEVISGKNNQHTSPQNLARNPPKSEVLKRPVVGSTTESKQPKKDASGLKTDSLKTDKRQWALEFLARKSGTNVTKEKEEGSAIPKDKYPLLAKLPKDMQPVLAPIHRNKVPISIRQAQLYRLTEHFLREANLPELAVADAVNIEKEVANRSSCKLVYLNMCSHQLSRRSDNVNSGKEQTTPSSSVQSDVPEGSHDTSSDHEANEALRLAGLVDTPPSSPPQPEVAVLYGENEDDGPDNVIEMDAQPELDIYGDFEYNFEDDDIIGPYASAVKKTPEPMQDGPTMKVLFSTLNLSKSNGSQDISECPTETGSSVRESQAHDEQPQTDIANEESGDPSLAECEELYGPDKEPLAVKYPETVAIKPPEIGTGSETVKESNSSASHSNNADQAQRKKDGSTANSDKQADHNLVFKKVEAYVKEHIRPLCKSGVITVEQYRWSVGKTTEKVMKYHSKEKNANFLIKEGEKVKKLAERYVETAQQTV